MHTGMVILLLLNCLVSVFCKTEHFDDGTYEGPVKVIDGKKVPDGYGKMYYKNFAVYEGYWVNGKRDGKYSTLTFFGKCDQAADSSCVSRPVYNKYVGEFRDDIMSGQGRMQYSNGDVYDGEWLNNRKHGIGFMRYSNGDVYDGNWLYNLKHGYGVMRYSNGEVYSGTWLEGMKSGSGTFKWTNGDEYTGAWIEGRRSGFGHVIIKATDSSSIKETYHGFWLNDLRNGHGLCSYFNGDVYEGEWINDLRSGTGTMKYLNRGLYIGSWQNNLKHGFGNMIYSSGDIYEGDWLEGKITGHGTYIWNDTKYGRTEYVGGFLAGSKHGRGTIYYSNGLIITGNWHQNIKNGKFEITSTQDSKKRRICSYQNDVLHGDDKVWNHGRFNITIWNNGKIEPENPAQRDMFKF